MHAATDPPMPGPATYAANLQKLRNEGEGELKLTPAPFGKQMRKWFPFPSNYRNLNHGSFGTVPIPVNEHRQRLLYESDARPDRFARFDYPRLLLEGRMAFADLLHAPYENVVLVPNVTTAANVVLRNIEWKEGDRILYFSCAYGACAKTILSVCETTPAQPEKLELRLTGPQGGMADDEIVQLVEDKIKELEAKKKKQRARLLLFDTFVSLPGIRMPFERLTKACRSKGVLSLVDAAHLAGCADLDVPKLDPDFLLTNAHKWAFVPRSCAAFYVRENQQEMIRTGLPTGHGFVPKSAKAKSDKAKSDEAKSDEAKSDEAKSDEAKSDEAKSAIYNPFEPGPGEESAFATNFRYCGTIDPTPFFCVTAALEFRQKVCGGEAAVIEYCNKLAREGGARVAEILGTEVMDNASGTFARDVPMVNVRLPLDLTKVKTSEKGIAGVGRWMESCCVDDKENETFIKIDLFEGSFWTRLSAQVYLELEDFAFAGRTLKDLCRRVEAGDHLS